MTNTMLSKRAALAACAALISAGAAGCGDDEQFAQRASVERETPATQRPVDTADAPTTNNGGYAAAVVESCLTDAGLGVEPQASQPYGVLVPVEGLSVHGFPQNGLTGADLWIFEDAEAADDHFAVITSQDEPSPAAWVDDNMIVRFWYPPENEDDAALRSCLNE